MGFSLPAINTLGISLSVVTKTYATWDDPFSEYAGIRDSNSRPAPFYVSRLIAAADQRELHDNLHFAATDDE